MTSSPPTNGTSPARRLRFPSFTTQIFLGLIVGVALGFVAHYLGDDHNSGLLATMAWVGSSFVTLLKALVPPLIVAAMIVSITNLRGVANAASLAVKTLMWFAITALISVSIGLVLALLVNPGRHTSVSADSAQMPSRIGQWSDFLNGLIPSNFMGLEIKARLAEDLVTASPSFNALQILVIGIALGAAALKVGDAAQPFVDVAASLLKVLQKVLWGVIRLAPIGTAGLIGTAVATYGWDKVSSLGAFILTVYVGLIVVGAIVYPAILRVNGLSPLAFYRGAWPAIQLAFVSRSSLGTLPVTEKVTVESLGVPRSYGAFATSLGATTKMDGCAAIYPAVSAVFVAQFFGIDLALSDYFLIVFVAVVGSAATAGLTGATVMLTLTLSTLGLPLEGVGLLLAIDPILDMGRTALNVAGQALVPVVVARREGILDEERFASARANAVVAD